MVVMSEPCAVAMLALVAALAGVEFSSSTSIHREACAQALQDLLLLAATGVLLTAFASIHRQLHRHRAAPAVAAAADARTEVAFGVVCAAVGVLQFLLLLRGGEVTRRDCALGAGAVLVLPAASSATFFLAMALIFAHVAHGGAVVAGDGPPVQTPGWILTKLTLGAAAGVVVLIALAQYP